MSLACKLLFSVQMSVQWNTVFQRPSAVQALCTTFNVHPIPPDSVENIVLTFTEAFPKDPQYIVTLRYNWTAPDFPGEGIIGYQAWLEKDPAPTEVESGKRLQQLGANERSAQTQAGFESNTANFILYFQVVLILCSLNHARSFSNL